jgi:ADP-dependent NAD(P)H-hydrate dehydratase
MSGRPELVTPQLLREWPLPEPGGSKHGRGQVLVVGGARSTPGAAMLAGIAALRVGAGVLSLAVAESVAAQVAVAVPECSVIALPQDETGAVTAEAAQVLAPRLADCEAVLIGPGLDDADRTLELLEALVPHATEVGQLILDAYALGVLTDVEGREQWRDRLTLTPNRDEAARLLGIDNRNLDRVGDEVDVAAAVAERYAACVSYQGCVHDGESGWLVPFGHSGLGTSGSGDVLAGAVAGLLARGADRARATCWATYLHAAAGDRLAPTVGRVGFLARELVDTLPRVLTELQA